MHYQRTTQRGFTIVELLIVIVVIGILAAITIVAYNGIQERARTAAATSALAQANKKLELYAVENSGYPTSLAAAGVTDTGAVKYQYTADTSTTPNTYCVTATTGATSYNVSSANATPAAGGCAGHGVGGVDPITNLVLNPNLTSLAFMSGSGTGTNTLVSSGAATGTTFGRRTYTADSASGAIYFGNFLNLQAGRTYAASAMLRASKPVSMRLTIDWKNSAGTFLGSSGSSNQTIGTSWTRVTVSGVAPATASQVTITAPSSTAWVTNDYQDIDSVMLIDGSATGGYADGSTPNWVWNGTTNNSTSTGPPV